MSTFRAFTVYRAPQSYMPADGVRACRSFPARIAVHRALLSLTLILLVAVPNRVSGQGEPAAPGLSGSLVEDRAARKLVEAGSARYQSDEVAKAVEIWQSVIERYPRSRVRYIAHVLLGNHFLERDRSYDQARTHFEAAASEENADPEQRAQAMLSMLLSVSECSGPSTHSWSSRSSRRSFAASSWRP